MNNSNIISFDDIKQKSKDKLAKDAIEGIMHSLFNYMSAKVILLTDTIYFENTNELFMSKYVETINGLMEYCKEKIVEDINSLVDLLPGRIFIDKIDVIIIDSVIYYMENLQEFINNDE